MSGTRNLVASKGPHSMGRNWSDRCGRFTHTCFGCLRPSRRPFRRRHGNLCYLSQGRPCTGSIPCMSTGASQSTSYQRKVCTPS